MNNGTRRRGATIEPLERRALLSVTPVTLAAVPGSAPRVAVDAAGNVFGTTLRSGDSAGSVFEIVAGTHVAKTLATFGPVDPAGNVYGVDPGDILIDAAGNLFGDATVGGVNAPRALYPNSAGGTLWELPAGSSTLRVLYSFGPEPGQGVVGDGGPRSLTMDDAGNLYGSAYGPAAATPSLLPFDFKYEAATGTLQYPAYSVYNVRYVSATQASDSAGNVYALIASRYGGPAVIRLVPGAPAADPGVTVVNSDAKPVGVAVDAADNAFITTSDGSVWEALAGTSTLTVRGTLGSDAGGFFGSPVVGPAGDLFAVTFDSATGTGALVELPAGSSTFVDLLPIGSEDEARQLQGVMEDRQGNLYGTRLTADGTVAFELPGVGSAVPVAAAALLPVALKADFPRGMAIFAGDRLHGCSVTITLRNTGTATTTAGAAVSLYAGDASGATTPLSSRPLATVVKPGRVVTVKLPVRSLPGGVDRFYVNVDGQTYYVSTAASKVGVSEHVVTLSSTARRITAGTSHAGDRLPFILEVTNSGNTTTAGPVGVAVTLEGTLGKRHIVLSEIRGVPRTVHIKPERSVSLRIWVTLPTDNPSMDGTLYVLFSQNGQSVTTPTLGLVFVR